MVRWFDSVETVDCIFAIDGDSTVDKNGVTFSNHPLKSLSFLNGMNDSSRRSYTGKVFSEKSIKTYKSLYIDSSNLLFETPLALPEKFSLILKTGLNSSSTFISNNGADYGPCFAVEHGDSQGKWRVKGFEAMYDIPEDILDLNKKGSIHTLIIKADLTTKEVEIITDFGKYTLPQDSLAFTYFFKSQSYTTLGDYHTTSPEWRLDADIVAYGIFEGVLNDTEIDQILYKIDEQFLIHETSLGSDLREGFSVTKDSIYYNTKFSEPSTVTSWDYEKITNFDIYLHDSKEVHVASEPSIDSFEKNTQVLVYKIVYEDVRYFKNSYQIEDYVYEEGEPVISKIFLYERDTGALVQTTRSNSEGFFKFSNLDKTLDYFVHSSDKKYQFKSIVKDYLKGGEI